MHRDSNLASLQFTNVSRTGMLRSETLSEISETKIFSNFKSCANPGVKTFDVKMNAHRPKAQNSSKDLSVATIATTLYEKLLILTKFLNMSKLQNRLFQRVPLQYIIFISFLIRTFMLKCVFIIYYQTLYFQVLTYTETELNPLQSRYSVIPVV